MYSTDVFYKQLQTKKAWETIGKLKTYEMNTSWQQHGKNTKKKEQMQIENYDRG